MAENWSLPEITITWDNSTTVKVTPRQSDIARVELLMGQAFSVKMLSYAFMFRLAYTACTRMALLPTPPPDLEEFMDSVTLDWG